MRYAIPLLGALFLSTTPAIAQVSIGIGLPGVSIGVNFPVYPNLVRIPGYPVYYAPDTSSNFFFYDGMYWLYQGDNWYASSWYNGPWGYVGPQSVPLFVLRIPVGYYRAPPSYFRDWHRDAPPRWGDHWGNDWVQQRSGWDRWNRSSVPAPAPLPTYQRQYSGDRYPQQVEQQRNIHEEKYRYQPRDALVREREQMSPAAKAPMPEQHERSNLPQPERQGSPQHESQRPPDTQRGTPPMPSRQDTQVAPRPSHQQRGDEDVQRAAPAPAPVQQRGPVDRDQMQPARQAPEKHQQALPERRQEQAPEQRQQAPEQRPQQVPDQRPQQPEKRQQQAPQEQGRGQRQDKERDPGQGQDKEHDSGQGQGRNR